MKYYLGIDPGYSGAMAIVNEEGIATASIKLSETETDLYDWLKYRIKEHGIRFAYLEKVHSMPRQGVSSSFKFGKSFGFCIGLITAMCVSWDFVSPQKWQKELGCLTKGDKNVTKKLAQRLWPDMKITHAIADALLIAEYTRRTRA